MSTDPLKNQERIGSPIQGPSDWLKVNTASLSHGALAEQLTALRLLRKEFGDSLCIIQTVFHPFSIASDLLDNPKDLIRHYQDHWTKLKNGMEAITETFRKYVKTMLKERLVEGIFFAIKDWGTTDMINNEEYGEAARPFDLAVLEEAQAGEFNVLHVCKSNNRLLSFLDYPVHGFNWDSADTTNPGLKEAAAKTEKFLIGGMAHRGSLLSGSPEAVEQEKERVLTEAAGLRFILGAGCTVSVETPEKNLKALKQKCRFIPDK
jgi:uroporphyrinogen decarboxylase